jgi:hypothetical protein
MDRTNGLNVIYRVMRGTDSVQRCYVFGNRIILGVEWKGQGARNCSSLCNVMRDQAIQEMRLEQLRAALPAAALQLFLRTYLRPE